MGTDQPALRALFASESGLSETEIGLEHVLLIWQKKHDKWVKWQNSHGARFAKTTANCSNCFCHFHLIFL
jgi:endonuclease I